jgi:hypothetical protein
MLNGVDQPCQTALPSTAGSGEGVSHFEQLEFAEIPILGVDRADAVLEENGRDMGIGNEVAPNGCFARHFPVRIQKTIHARVGGDAEIRH